ncbi:hypothetical protein BGX30_006167 [Mortierella sp. GBA39]|nr:hypothetical protein BGX30_006167 [Mortierella sp. GBA39]
MIGIIGAMDEEVELLLAGMEGAETVTKAGVKYARGTYRGKPVIVCKSGVGKVNAAVTTQILIDQFGVGKVLFTGVAGAVHPELNIGDIVISSDCVQHDMDVSPLGYARGVIPYQEVSEFKADASLIALAQEACQALGEVNCKVAWFYEHMEGACVEMEGSAVAQVCYMNGVPFVVIRSMSDKADGSAHANFAEFTVASSRRSHAILDYMVQRL